MRSRENRAELLAHMRQVSSRIEECLVTAEETNDPDAVPVLRSALLSWRATVSLMLDLGDEEWVDHLGRTWTLPPTTTPLSFIQKPESQALRLFIFTRDNFTCRCCRLTFTPPTNYDGSFAPSSVYGRTERTLQIDHVRPRSDGGSHHPNNLQSLCSSCNARKGPSDRTPVAPRMGRT